MNSGILARTATKPCTNKYREELERNYAIYKREDGSYGLYSRTWSILVQKVHRELIESFDSFDDALKALSKYGMAWRNESAIKFHVT